MSSACIRFVLREPSQALLLCLVVSVFALILSPQSCLLPFSLSSAFCLSILPAPAPAPAPPPRLLLPPPPARFWLLWVGWLCMRVLACSYPPFCSCWARLGGGQRCSTHTQPCSHHISTHVHTCAGCCHPQTKQLSLHLHTPVCVQWTLFSFPSSTPFFCFLFFLKRKQERSQSPLSLPCVSVSVCPFVCLCLSVRAHACCSLLFCSAFWGPIGVECHGGKRGKLAS